MDENNIVYTIFLIFTGASVLATLALYARQALILAYILLGVMFGPWGFALVTDQNVIRGIADIGIIFLLFLLGLNLQPQDLLSMVKKTTWITLLSSTFFAALVIPIVLYFGYSYTEAFLVAAVSAFSSTIIGLKLLPTTILHHQRMGEVIISVLLLQDLVAIVLLMVLQASGHSGQSWLDIVRILVSLPLLVFVAWFLQRYLVMHLIRRFDTIREYIFLLAIGWCLGIAELSEVIGLSHEIGAFIAGVSLAVGPVAVFIAESLKPLRDFFLVLFFFTIGASFDVGSMENVVFPAVLIAATMLIAKPLVFSALLQTTGESAQHAKEIGFRLGQMSEFSLLVAVVAVDAGMLSQQGSYLIQLSTLLTFVFSTYFIVLRFPTPIAVSDKLRRD